LPLRLNEESKDQNPIQYCPCGGESLPHGEKGLFSGNSLRPVIQFSTWRTGPTRPLPRPTSLRRGEVMSRTRTPTVTYKLHNLRRGDIDN